MVFSGAIRSASYCSRASWRLLRQAIELRAEDGGLEFSKAVIEANDAVMELVGEAGAAGVDVTLHQFHVLEIVGDDGSAFAGGNEFARLKTERAQIAHGAGAFALPHAAVGVGAILDDFEIVLLGDAEDLVHIGEAHAEMDGQNGFGFGGDGLLDELGVHAVGIGIDVDEHRNGIEQQNRADGSLPGIGGSEDFVTGLNADGFERGLNGDGAGVDALGIFRGV